MAAQAFVIARSRGGPTVFETTLSLVVQVTVESAVGTHEDVARCCRVGNASATALKTMVNASVRILTTVAGVLWL